MIVEKFIHPVWQEFLSIPKNIQKQFKILPNLIGKFQYIYSSKNGKISLIQTRVGLVIENKVFEIYCLEGNLFDGLERFSDKKTAIKRIKELLE
jgi:hypothetical protein